MDASDSIRRGRPRTREPSHPPHPAVANLRARGWSNDRIASEVGASVREVRRWEAGDTRPIGVYERALSGLLAA